MVGRIGSVTGVWLTGLATGSRHHFAAIKVSCFFTLLFAVGTEIGPNFSMVLKNDGIWQRCLCSVLSCPRVSLGFFHRPPVVELGGRLRWGVFGGAGTVSSYSASDRRKPSCGGQRHVSSKNQGHVDCVWTHLHFW